MLVHIPDVISTHELAHIRQVLDAADWTDGRETVGPLGAGVKRNQQLPEGASVRAAMGKLVLAALARHPLFFAAALPLKIMPPRFNRYAGGGEYGFHIDGAVMRLGDGTQLRSDLACTLFLSEPDSYAGGELVVSDTYGEHEVKLPAGDLVLYPASSRHRVSPVAHGTRLAAFFWIQSMVRDDARRRLLFEMDSSIEALRRSGADGEPVLQLTGVYHNLLRGWAEV